LHKNTHIRSDKLLLPAGKAVFLHSHR